MDQKTISDWIMYHEIHRLSALGFSQQNIATYLVLNRRTVSSYLAMDEQQYEQHLLQKQSRSKLLDAYKDFVVLRLKTYPDTSAAQMHDWLKEYDADLPTVNPKTVYNFVMELRRQYNLPLIEESPRQFAPVQELNYGQQAQVDFGCYHLRTTASKTQKVWFFAMSLSASRMKFCCFQTKPFTTADVCAAHEKAFDFYQGIAHTIVYDQDSTLLYDENAGELLLTALFRQYTQSRSFQLHFCRKADPQSKGYVKPILM